MNETKTRSIYALLNAWDAAVSGTAHPRPPAYTGPDVHLSAIVEHSGLVTPGACFVARLRTGSDGHPFIGQALTRGAALILGQRDPAGLNLDLGPAPYLQVADTAVAEAWLAAAWHDFPGRRLVLIGVTGTDGKTTTANLIYSILGQAGLKAGLLSTLKAAVGGREEPLALHVTTPEAPVIQAYLRQMVEAGVSHCVIEVTSHGLAQERVGALDFDLAVVTNITHEHLDYHGDFEGYFAAKARLFHSLSAGAPAAHRQPPSGLVKTAVLNRDDESYDRLAAISTPRQLTYSLDRPADVRAANIRSAPGGVHFTLILPSLVEQSPLIEVAVAASLVGRFNLYNMLAAAAAAHALGIDPSAVKDGLEKVTALAGRMQPIERGQPFRLLVDFAHTPNALRQAISAARSMTAGRVIVVFGSAGKRDVAKRLLMAQIAARDADLAVLTAEDPRTESLDAILEMMAGGCLSEGGLEGQTFWRVADRSRAIYFALGLAQPEDLVLICGKGHEQSMCFGVTEYPWDDVDAGEAALAAFLAGQPAPDSGLPTYGPAGD